MSGFFTNQDFKKKKKLMLLLLTVKKSCCFSQGCWTPFCPICSSTPLTAMGAAACPLSLAPAA